jgi:hypothetical protein
MNHLTEPINNPSVVVEGERAQPFGVRGRHRASGAHVSGARCTRDMRVVSIVKPVHPSVMNPTRSIGFRAGGVCRVRACRFFRRASLAEGALLGRPFLFLFKAQSQLLRVDRPPRRCSALAAISALPFDRRDARKLGHGVNGPTRNQASELNTHTHNCHRDILGPHSRAHTWPFKGSTRVPPTYYRSQARPGHPSAATPRHSSTCTVSSPPPSATASLALDPY